MANTQPIYMATPVSGWTTLTSASTATDGTGANVVTLITAGASGAKPREVRAIGLGTNVATKLMIFQNNGSTPATAANNSLYKELSMPATTASNTTAINEIVYQFPEDFVLPAGYKINVCIATAVAAGISVSCNGGQF